jgi:hypothetical protein
MATTAKNVVGPQVRIAIAKIEGGTRCVSDGELLELAKAFRCPLGDLFPARVQAVVRGRK